MLHAFAVQPDFTADSIMNDISGGGGEQPNRLRRASRSSSESRSQNANAAPNRGDFMIPAWPTAKRGSGGVTSTTKHDVAPKTKQKGSAGSKSSAKSSSKRRQSAKRSSDGSNDKTVAEFMTGGYQDSAKNSSCFPPFEIDYSTYQRLASKTCSVVLITKLAYPNCHHVLPCPWPAYYNRPATNVTGAHLYDDMSRINDDQALLNRTVYDIDEWLRTTRGEGTKLNTTLTCDDADRIGKPAPGVDHLVFNATFESGNLRKAVQVRDFEYDLILLPDVNTNHHIQWFYFEVSNVRSDVSYRFNILNNEKPRSQFQEGMCPLLFSVTGAEVNGQKHWQRVGSDIAYYKNYYMHPSGGFPNKTFYTLSFTTQFQHDRDVCYLAYFLPYTYTQMMTELEQWQGHIRSIGDDQDIFFKQQELCTTVGGNSSPVLTITAQSNAKIARHRRNYIVLSARIHPGESNSSWVMRGVIAFLLSDSWLAAEVRKQFIFKIVPMINVDGVVNGCHRCGLTGDDLNRQWIQPSPMHHPEVYHLKCLINFITLIGKRPLVFIDFHGHSNQKNIFMYGCSPALSWLKEKDTGNPAVKSSNGDDDPLLYETLPKVLADIGPAFSFENCGFRVNRDKESTGRIVAWRQFGIAASYTLESTYCGFDTGRYKGQHINMFHLQEMGQKICEAFKDLPLRMGLSQDNGQTKLSERLRGMSDKMKTVNIANVLGAAGSSTAGQSDEPLNAYDSIPASGHRRQSKTEKSPPKRLTKMKSKTKDDY